MAISKALREKILDRDWHIDVFAIEKEIHHIKPRHEGGSDNPSNLIAINKSKHRDIFPNECEGITNRKELRHKKNNFWNW